MQVLYTFQLLFVCYLNATDKRCAGVVGHTDAPDHKPLGVITVMAEKQHTQTRPKDRGFPCFIFLWNTEVLHG